MVTIYTSNSCSSCRKAIKWLKENNIQFKEVNFISNNISRDDVILMLKNSENGFNDIISKRSKVFNELDKKLDEMSFDELVNLILDNPSILKRPIIIDDNRFLVGYNDEDISTFVPNDVKAQWICPNDYETCEYDMDLSKSIKKN